LSTVVTENGSHTPANGKRVWTVDGPIGPDQLGLTLTHEHLAMDGSCFFLPADGADAELAELPLAEEILDRVRRASCSNRDNLLLNDPSLVRIELEEFTRLGGRTVVDVTSGFGLGRDPGALQAIADAAGVQIVMGCGFYCEYAHPDFVGNAEIDELAQMIVHDVRTGVDGVRAGVIGEIGVNGQERGTLRYLGEITPDEEKVLRAALRASLETDAAVVIHQPNRAAAVYAIIEILESEQARPERTVLAHMSSVPDFSAHRHALERGYWIAYDNFGMELHNAWYRPIGDSQRVEWLLEVFRLGFGHRIVVSHDVWCKLQLRRYGGNGYGHLLRTIVPQLRESGLTDDDVEQLLVRNPAEVLAF
jgi:phosphotriesterase-related protein